MLFSCKSGQIRGRKCLRGIAPRDAGCDVEELPEKEKEAGQDTDLYAT
jgi:hypothetical protein